MRASWDSLLVVEWGFWGMGWPSASDLCSANSRLLLGSLLAADAAAAAFYAARPKALRLLRQLAQASKAAARQLQEEGLVRFALDQLLRPAGMAVEPVAAGSGSSGSSLKQRGQLAEALRLWRSFAQHGFYLLLLDDAYPSLCTHFTPPPLPAAASGAGQEQLQHWAVAREAYAAAAQLCWHAARCAGPVEPITVFCLQ